MWGASIGRFGPPDFKGLLAGPTLAVGVKDINGIEPNCILQVTRR